ncbi:MAG: hypothetical protein ACR2P2_11985 [Nakamurella sp.]
MADEEFMNAHRPAQVPVRPSTDAYPVRARLIRLDGEETWTAATVVRHAPGHVMCRITTAPAAVTATEYIRPQSTYVWLFNDDVEGSRNSS